MVWRAWLPDRTVRPWQAAVIGVALAAAATVFRLLVLAPLGRELPFIAYFPVLIVASALGGLIGGAACLLVATLAAIRLLTPFGAAPAWVLGSFWIAGALVVAVSAALAESVREQRRSRAKLTETQAQLQTLVGELAHRGRNALFVIMAIVSQSARAAGSVDEAERTINARLAALLRAQDVLVGGDGGAADLRSLIERALEPFDLSRIAIGPAPDVQVEADVAMGLGLLFHELATNALKYGALSTPQGRVLVEWTSADGFARLVWLETGGPPVTEPSKKGFGTRLLEAALRPQGGEAERRYEPDGLICVLRIPDPSRAAKSGAPAGSVFAGQLQGDAANA